MSVEKLKRRIAKAEAVKQNYRALFEAAYELALPQRNLYTTFSQGSSKMEKVFDSTGISGINGFVNRMQSSLTPSFTKWAELQAGPAIPQEKRQEINKILEVVTDIIFSVINASNFSVAVGEMYYDLAVGTGALLVTEGDDLKPVKFSSVPTSELAMDEGENGFIAGIFRTHKVSARGIMQTWKDAKLSSELFDAIKENPDKEIEFKEATYYEEEKKWCYKVLYNDDVIVDREMESNPWIIVRWSKIAGEIFGRGPLLQALPDLKMLNKGKEIQIRSAQLDVFGAYMVANGSILNPNTIKLSPNAMIPVTHTAGPNGPAIAPIPRKGDFNAQSFMFEELKQQINTLLLNNRLPPDAGPVRSATEIVQRMKELQTDIGAAFGRLIFEFVQPLLQRIIQILEKKGLISFGGGIKIDNMAITTQILSPLARSQGIEDVNSLVQTQQILTQFDPTGNLTGLTLKIEDLGTWIADKLGVSPSLIATADEKLEYKKNIAQAIEQQTQQPVEPNA